MQSIQAVLVGPCRNYLVVKILAGIQDMVVGGQTSLLQTYGLFFRSLRNMFLHIGFSYNYHLDLSQLSPIIASPGNWSYLSSQVFRNTGNLPILWLLEGGG